MNKEPVVGGIYLADDGSYYVLIFKTKKEFDLVQLPFNDISIIKQMKSFININYQVVHVLNNIKNKEKYFQHGYCGKVKEELLDFFLQPYSYN